PVTGVSTMTTIYMDRASYRRDMRGKGGSARPHAICRKLLGCAQQRSKWYGAHYWAACALCQPEGLDEPIDERLQRYRERFACEAHGSHDAELSPAYAALWALAVRRVQAILPEALALDT